MFRIRPKKRRGRVKKSCLGRRRRIDEIIDRVSFSPSPTREESIKLKQSPTGKSFPPD